jgi:hypothetical protein
VEIVDAQRGQFAAASSGVGGQPNQQQVQFAAMPALPGRPVSGRGRLGVAR